MPTRPPRPLRPLLRLLSFVACLAFAPTGFAQIAEEDVETPVFRGGDAPSSTRITFRVSERVFFGTDFENESGDVLTSHTDASLAFRSRVTEKLALDIGFGAGYTLYDFGGTPDPLFTSNGALEDAYDMGLRVGGRWTIDETWSVVGGGFGRVGLASGADFDDALVGGGFVAAGYKESGAFSLDIGVLVSSRLEDDPLVVPYIAINWAIDERLTLVTTGLGARLDARLNDEWTAFVRGQYETRAYRLSDDFAPLPGGAVRDEFFPVGVGFRYSPTPSFEIMLEGGVIVARRFEFFDNDENNIRTIETESGAFLGIRFSISF